VTGPRIPGYTHLQHLGSGGFADVFLYEQSWPQQRVAVKVVRDGVALTDHEKSLFTSEANAMARLADHPYIVDVITAGVTDPDQGARPFLVMRYCPPPDLGARVRAQPMAVPEAVSTGIKLASAIETAHRVGILHRDIKPSNVLVTPYQEPALTDFGIAGHVSEVDQEHELRISYPWAPPELIDGTSNGSVASDVYSLGATIWNLLTGRSPFSVPGGDNSSHALTTRALHAAPPSLQRPDAPPALDRLLQMCLAKRPDLRPRSALELAHELQRIETAAGFTRTPIAVAGDQPVVTTTPPPDAGGDATTLKPVSIDATGPAPRSAPPGTPTTPDEPPREPVSRSTKVWGAVGAIVLGVLAVVLATTLGDGDRPDRPPELEPDPSFTPSDVVPEAPIPEPAVRGRRSGRDVTFTWRVLGGTKAGDTWVWRRPDTGESARGTAQELTVTAAKRVCLQVQLIRNGEPSTSTQKCVE